MQEVNGTAACLDGVSTGPSNGVWCKEWRFLKSQTGNFVRGFPFNPTELDVYLVSGATALTIIFNFIVPPQDTIPLDIMILQDTSGSMGDDITNLYKLAPNLINGVLAFQYDVTFGLATFIDHRTASTTACGSAPCPSVEVYNLRNPLTNNFNIVTQTIQALATQVYSNYDTPESGYEAMLFAAVGGPPPGDGVTNTNTANCKYVGWRPTARHVAIMITDDIPKCSEAYSAWPGDFTPPADAKVTNGVTNNYDCIVNYINPSTGYIDTTYLGENLPSVAGIANKFSATKFDIYPIFYTAITSGEGRNIQTFLNGHITNNFKRGKWGQIGGSTTLETLVMNSLKEMAATVSPIVILDPGGFYVANSLIITSNPCCPNYATQSCVGLLVPGCVIQMRIQLIRNVGNNAGLNDVVVKVAGFGNIVLTIHVRSDKFFCLGCTGLNDDTVVDYCGVCNGLNVSCTSCDGVVAPSQIIKVNDICNVCGGDGTSCWDCKNLVFNTDPNSYRYDACNVCLQRSDPLWNTTCLDCLGVFNGIANYDFCGVCNGGNTCLGCDGNPPPSGQPPKQVDACGVCGGTGSSCVGCDGIVGSGKKFDV